MSSIADLNLQDRDGGVLVKIRAVPGSSREKVAGIHGDALKVTLSAPAEKGKANKQLLRILGETLSVPARAILLVSGSSSRDKMVLIPDFDSQRLRVVLSKLLSI